VGGIDEHPQRATISAAADQRTRQLGRVGIDAPIDGVGDISKENTRVDGVVEMFGERLCGAMGSEEPFTAVRRISGGHAKQTALSGLCAIRSKEGRDKLDVVDEHILWLIVGCCITELARRLSCIADASCSTLDRARQEVRCCNSAANEGKLDKIDEIREHLE